jgi:ribonuclease Z
MAKVVILGSSNAIPSEKHDNTYLAVVTNRRTVLVDCTGNPTVRLPQAGIDFDSISDLVLTHFHPDHVSAVPLFLMNLWLLGRRHPLTIHGLDYTLSRLETLMEMYEWSSWPNFFPISFHRLPEEELTLVLEDEALRLVASPVRHLIPNIGLRFEFLTTGKAMVYSSDTEPAPEVVRLASGADVLIHEAAGATPGHSSPSQAGSVAHQAEVGALYLIHYPSQGTNLQDFVDEASRKYSGKVELAIDFMELNFSSG